MKRQLKVCVAWILLAAMTCGFAGCMRSDPVEETEEETKVENTPVYIRNGNTTDFVTSGIDIDAMLARPYDNTVPVAFSEGVFALHSYGWGFDNDTLFSTGNGTGLGMPIEIFVDGIKINHDSAVWRPTHVTAIYSSATENGQPKSTNIASTAAVSATYTSTYDPDGIAHLTDGIINFASTPRNRWSNYVSGARAKDSLTFDFKCESHISSVTVYPYDDDGATRLPSSMQLEYYSGGAWQAVPDQVCGTIQKNKGVEITFSEINAEKLRLTLIPQSGKSVGVTEVEIFGYNEKAQTLPQGISVEEKKFVTANDVATSIITVKNDTGKDVTLRVSATPSNGYSETAYAGRYVLFGALDSNAKSVIIPNGESVEFRSALAFSAEKGENEDKLSAVLADSDCIENHAREFADWFAQNVPYFDCDDEQILQTYYFRWLTYRNNIRMIEAEWDGYIISEFLPNVSWSGLYNSISCPAMYHFNEGRWIRDEKYLDDYQEFWFINGANPRLYSFPIADAYYNRYLVTGNSEELTKYLDALDKNFAAWEKSHYKSDYDLFYQRADRDGMEKGVGGDGLRPTINSYMYADALAIAEIARMIGNTELAQKYEAKAADLKKNVIELLWNESDGFFETLTTDGVSVGVRELIGYVPWAYNLPDDNKTYSAAFAQLLDPQGFLAAYGPTTLEQRNADFMKTVFGAGCRWDGPSWPFATSQTLMAAANLLNNYSQNDVFDSGNWLDMLKTYAASQYKDGYSWIAEDLHPLTGEWIVDLPRSIHYNHSSYADLVITGLVGIRPTNSDETLTVNPLIGEGKLTHFALENVSYRGHNITVIYDADGSHYALGAGMKVFVDGYLMAESAEIAELTVSLLTPEN